MPSRPSYKTIAELAGVSQMTVSLAFRNSPTIRPDTRQRVLNAAGKLGYKPDPEVKRLLSYIRDRKAVQVQSALAALNFFPTRSAFLNSPFRKQLWQGIVSRAESLGYHIELFDLHNPELSATRLSSILTARSIYGVILPTAPAPVSDTRWVLPSVATVSTSYLFDNLSIDRVHFDAHGMLRVAFEQIRRAGFLRVGMSIEPKQDEHSSGEWLAAYLRYQFDQPRKERVPVLSKKSITDKHLTEWINHYEPQVVLSPDNGICQRLAKLDTRYRPQFVSLNWSPRARHCAGVSPNPELIGSAAVDLLTAHIHRNETGVPENRKSVTVEPTWHDGPSLVDAQL